MAEVKQKLITPSVPNFILIETKPGRKHDGLQESPKIAIGELPNETLEEIAADWKKELLRVAQAQRDNAKYLE